MPSIIWCRLHEVGDSATIIGMGRAAQGRASWSWSAVPVTHPHLASGSIRLGPGGHSLLYVVTWSGSGQAKVGGTLLYHGGRILSQPLQSRMSLILHLQDLHPSIRPTKLET